MKFRFFQYRIRTLLALVLVISVFSGWIVYKLNEIEREWRREQEIADHFVKLGAKVESKPITSWLKNFVGNERYWGFTELP